MSGLVLSCVNASIPAPLHYFGLLLLLKVFHNSRTRNRFSNWLVRGLR